MAKLKKLKLIEEDSGVNSAFFGNTFSSSNSASSPDSASTSNAIEGTELDDTLSGTVENDIIYGLGGNDGIFADNGNDEVYGGDGNDSIDGWNDDDFLDGGNGDDTLLGWYGNDRLYGGEGNDTLDGEYGRDAVFGGNGDDYVYASEYESTNWSADFFDGGEGLDILDYTGSAAAIFLNLTSGSGGGAAVGDRISYTVLDGKRYSTFEIIGGSRFDDRIIGAAGNEALHGLDGNDRLDGSYGEDTLYGGRGDDFISGGIGVDSDTLYGGFGNDHLNGMKGNDFAWGGEGADRINGGEGNDSLRGEAGDDWISGGEGEDFISGGDGQDTAQWDRGRHTTIKFLNPGAGSGQAETWTAGSAFGGSLLSKDEFTQVENHTADFRYNNILDWSGMTDPYAVTVDLAKGVYVVSSGERGAEPVATGTVKGFSWVVGGKGHDIIHGDWNHNFLSGKDGNDLLSGGGGSDSLLGGSGNDILIGGTGYDVASWEELDDISSVVVTLAGDKEESLAVIHRNLGNGEFIDEEDRLTGIQDLTGGRGNDSLTGNELDNWLTGGDGDDFLAGAADFAITGDCDYFWGGNGDDIIVADLHDYFDGGAGNDTVRLVGAGRVSIDVASGIIENADTGALIAIGYNIENWVADEGTEIVEITNPLSPLRQDFDGTLQQQLSATELAHRYG